MEIAAPTTVACAQQNKGPNTFGYRSWKIRFLGENTSILSTETITKVNVVAPTSHRSIWGVLPKRVA